MHATSSDDQVHTADNCFRSSAVPTQRIISNRENLLQSKATDRVKVHARMEKLKTADIQLSKSHPEPARGFRALQRNMVKIRRLQVIVSACYPFGSVAILYTECVNSRARLNLHVVFMPFKAKYCKLEDFRLSC